jgi:hypothetical protein
MEPPRRNCWHLQERDVALDCVDSRCDAPPVMLLRGYDLDADWAFYPYLAERLAEVRPVWIPVPPEPYSLLGELEQVEILARATAGSAGAVQLLRALDHRVESRLIGGLQPAVGQLLNAVSEATDQEATPIRWRLDPEVLLPERLKLRVAELRQACDLL